MKKSLSLKLIVFSLFLVASAAYSDPVIKSGSGEGSIEVGIGNEASGGNSSAFGYNNIVEGKGSSAFGYWSKATWRVWFRFWSWKYI